MKMRDINQNEDSITTSSVYPNFVDIFCMISKTQLMTKHIHILRVRREHNRVMVEHGSLEYSQWRQVHLAFQYSLASVKWQNASINITRLGGSDIDFRSLTKNFHVTVRLVSASSVPGLARTKKSKIG